MSGHKECYGQCERCVWRYNGGCSEWIRWYDTAVIREFWEYGDDKSAEAMDIERDVALYSGKPAIYL